MKQLILSLFIAFIALTGCSKDESVTNNYYIEYVKVQLNTKSVFNVEKTGLFRSTYEHQYPTEYKAYFVSLEKNGTKPKQQKQVGIVTDGLLIVVNL